MSASKPTQAEQIAALSAQVALLAQAVTALTTKPVSGAAASGPARSADGRDFACTAGGGCTRRLRSAARAAVHGVDKGGHEPRAI